MDKETESGLQALAAARDEARRVLKGLSDERMEHEERALRAQVGSLEHEERRSFGSLNGDGAEGLRVSAVKQAAQGRLRAMEVARAGRDSERREAQQAVRRADVELARGVTRAFTGTQAALEPRLLKLLADVAAVLAEGYDTAAALQKQWGVAPSLERLNAIRQGVAPLRAALGLPVWLTRREEAERPAAVKAVAERSQKDRTARYAEEQKRYDGLVRAGRVTPKEREKALAGNRKMWGLA